MSGASEESQVTMPTEADLKNLSEEERKKRAAQASEAAGQVQGMVNKLKSKAAALTDPEQRNKMLAEAYDREVEARGLSRKAKILESGTFQGAAGGAGVGAATAMGLGTAVGTLVGGVTSIPTTAVGTLVGAGTGAIHGPWIKLPFKKDKDGKVEEEQTLQIPQEAFDSGAVQIDQDTGNVTKSNPAALEKAISAATGNGNSSQPQQSEAGQRGDSHGESKEAANSKTKPESKGQNGEKRKPKKLEIRSKPGPNQGGEGKAEPLSQSESKPKRKPPKLEVRSKKPN